MWIGRDEGERSWQKALVRVGKDGKVSVYRGSWTWEFSNECSLLALNIPLLCICIFILFFCIIIHHHQSFVPTMLARVGSWQTSCLNYVYSIFQYVLCQILDRLYFFRSILTTSFYVLFDFSFFFDYQLAYKNFFSLAPLVVFNNQIISNENFLIYHQLMISLNAPEYTRF